MALVMAVASVLDLKSRRIPNVVTVTGVVLGLALRASVGADALMVGVYGVGLGLLLSAPFLMLGALGGGDAKLLAAAGAFLGPKDLFGACLLIGLLGGMLALVEAARRGTVRALVLNVFHIVSRWRAPDRQSVEPTLTPPVRMTIPYGVPIAVGALAWWFWGRNMI